MPDIGGRRHEAIEGFPHPSNQPSMESTGKTIIAPNNKVIGLIIFLLLFFTRFSVELFFESEAPIWDFNNLDRDPPTDIETIGLQQRIQ